MEFIVNAVVLSTDRTHSGIRQAKKSFNPLHQRINHCALDQRCLLDSGEPVSPSHGVGNWCVFGEFLIEYLSPIKAGEGNRTLVSSLGSWRSTIELHPQRHGEVKVAGEKGIVKDHGPFRSGFRRFPRHAESHPYDGRPVGTQSTLYQRRNCSGRGQLAQSEASRRQKSS